MLNAALPPFLFQKIAAISIAARKSEVGLAFRLGSFPWSGPKGWKKPWFKVSISQREATDLDSCHPDRMTLCTIPQLFYWRSCFLYYSITPPLLFQKLVLDWKTSKGSIRAKEARFNPSSPRPDIREESTMTRRAFKSCFSSRSLDDRVDSTWQQCECARESLMHHQSPIVE